MTWTTKGPNGSRLDRDNRGVCKSGHTVPPGKDGCALISCEHNYLSDSVHPGRPDRPEGPPPTITREDVQFCGHGNRADGGPCCVSEATKTTTILDVDRQYRGFREEYVDVASHDPKAEDVATVRLRYVCGAGVYADLDLVGLCVKELGHTGPCVPTDDVARAYPHVFSVARPLTPADQALETLALMAEHITELRRVGRGGWEAKHEDPEHYCDHPEEHMPTVGEGATIGDAVRACVQRIRGDRG